jgi:hypothetical protein
MLDRRQAWPAVLLMGFGMLTLALALKSSQGDVLLEPHWLMAIPALLYVGLGLALGGLTWRWPVLTALMASLQVLAALLLGWGYSAMEGAAREPYDALVHGLWEYAPGTALQVGWACFAGAVLAAWLQPAPVTGEEEVAPVAEAPALPSFPQSASPTVLCERAAAVPGVAAVVIATEGSVAGGGVWERDPLAALQRLRVLRRKCGEGLQTVPLGETVLVWRCEGPHLIALLTRPTVQPEVLYGLLRALWEATDDPATGE